MQPSLANLEGNCIFVNYTLMCTHIQYYREHQTNSCLCNGVKKRAHHCSTRELEATKVELPQIILFEQGGNFLLQPSAAHSPSQTYFFRLHNLQDESESLSCSQGFGMLLIHLHSLSHKHSLSLIPE